MKRLIPYSCLILLAAPLFALDYATYAPSAAPSAVQLTIWSDYASRGFSWQTDTTVGQGCVALVEGVHDAADDALFDASGLTATATVRSLTDAKYADPAVNAHTAHVEGLTPGRTYSYRVGSAGHYVYGTFAVRPVGGAVTILNINDVQTKDASLYPLYENTLAAAVGVVGGASAYDFILQGGDFYDGFLTNAGDNSTETRGTRQANQWGMAVDTSTPFFPGVPWVNVGGNHDMDAYHGTRLLVAEDFKVNCNTYYGCHSFDYGNVHVATIHFFSSTWPGNEARFERIFNWLSKDLAAAKDDGNTRWSVVAMHAGPYTTGDNMRGGSNYSEGQFASNLVMNISAICSSNHVDLVLQAHDHTYSKTRPYRWDAKGHAFSETDGEQVNLAPETEVFAGSVYDVNPRGTYYISAGCAGHRVGELAQYADRDGARSYVNRKLKVVTGTVNVDSPYASRGDDASADVGRQMFGVLRVNGNRLTYEFYVAEPNGGATLYDSFGILKEETPAVVSNATDFSALPSETVRLNPIANDAGAADASVTNRFWSWCGETEEGLTIGGGGVSGDGRCLDLDAGDGALFRNFSALTPLDAADAPARAVPIPDGGSVNFETHVRFRRSNVLPSVSDALASDKLVLGVYGNDERTALYAFAGYAGAAGREMRGFRLNVEVTDAWLAQLHHVRLSAFAGALADGTPGFVLELDGKRCRVAGVAAIVGGELAEESAAGEGYLGTTAVAARFVPSLVRRRLLLGLRPSENPAKFRALGFEGKGQIDDVAVCQLPNDALSEGGFCLTVR